MRRNPIERLITPNSLSPTSRKEACVKGAQSNSKRLASIYRISGPPRRTPLIATKDMLFRGQNTRAGAEEIFVEIEDRRFQYFGTLGSTSSDQAVIPPRRLLNFRNPAS